MYKEAAQLLGSSGEQGAAASAGSGIEFGPTAGLSLLALGAVMDARQKKKQREADATNSRIQSIQAQLGNMANISKGLTI